MGLSDIKSTEIGSVTQVFKYYMFDGETTTEITQNLIDMVSELETTDICKIINDFKNAADKPKPVKAQDDTYVGNYCMYINNELFDYKKAKKLQWVVAFRRTSKKKTRVNDKLKYVKVDGKGYYFCKDTRLLVPDIITYIAARGPTDKRNEKLPDNIRNRYNWSQAKGCEDIGNSVTSKEIDWTATNNNIECVRSTGEIGQKTLDEQQKKLQEKKTFEYNHLVGTAT